MLPQGMFSVAVATVLFPSLARFSTRGDMDGFRRTVSMGLRQIAFLLDPRRRRQRGARRADHPDPVPARRAGTPSQTPVVAGALAAFSAGLVFNGAMLMLNRAFFSLQSNWIPTIVALGNLALNAILDARLLPLRHVGHPALDGGLQRRRHGRAARPPAEAARPDRRRRDRRVDDPHRRRVRSRRGRRVRRLGPARRGARPVVRRPGRVARAGAASPRSRRTRSPVARSRCARCRRYSPCGAAPGAVRGHGPSAHPQLLDHRAHRPRQVDARRPHPPADRHGLGTRDARPDARLDGARARARHHDQGAGRARALEGPRAQPDRHARPRRLHLRGLALAPGVRGRAARRRRSAGDRGADARERVPRDREQPRDRPASSTRSTCRRPTPTAPRPRWPT